MIIYSLGKSIPWFDEVQAAKPGFAGNLRLRFLPALRLLRPLRFVAGLLDTRDQELAARGNRVAWPRHMVVLSIYTCRTWDDDPTRNKYFGYILRIYTEPEVRRNIGAWHFADFT